jgi:hypothetical protein
MFIRRSNTKVEKMLKKFPENGPTKMKFAQEAFKFCQTFVLTKSDPGKKCR